jgi:hypothetical protein
MSGHPGRPDHPDFWLLSQAILDLDAQADAGQGAEDIAGRMVDPACVAYMALQRGLRAEMMMPGRRLTAQRAAVPWMDGFLAGMMVQQLKTAQIAQTEAEDTAAALGEDDDMGFLKKLTGGGEPSPAPTPRRQGGSIPRMPKCPYCQEPVNHVSRCDQDGHGAHHQGCCPKPRTT